VFLNACLTACYMNQAVTVVTNSLLSECVLCCKVEKIVVSSTGALSSVDALNLVDQLEKKLTKRDAEELIMKLSRMKWLGKVSTYWNFLICHILSASVSHWSEAIHCDRMLN
jgi:acyl carrier protein